MADLRCTHVRQQEDGRWRAEFGDGAGTQVRMVSTLPLAAALEVGGSYRLDLTKLAGAPPEPGVSALPLLAIQLTGTVAPPPGDTEE